MLLSTAHCEKCNSEQNWYALLYACLHDKRGVMLFTRQNIVFDFGCDKLTVWRVDWHPSSACSATPKTSCQGRILPRGTRSRGVWPVSMSLVPVATRTTLLGPVGQIGCRGWQGRLMGVAGRRRPLVASYPTSKVLTAIPLTLCSTHLTIALLEKRVDVSRAAVPSLIDKIYIPSVRWGARKCGDGPVVVIKCLLFFKF